VLGTGFDIVLLGLAVFCSNSTAARGKFPAINQELANELKDASGL